MAFVISGLAGTFCAVVLLAAGVMKVGSPSIFGRQIAAYQIAPERVARFLGYTLPPVEMALGISILFIPSLAVAAAGLFLSFAFVIGVNLLRGRKELHCGCFGTTGKHVISRTHVAADVGLALLATLVFVDRHRPSFLTFQIGVSAFLITILAAAWRAMTPPLPRRTEEVSKR